MAWYDSPNNPLSGFLGGVVQHQEKDQALRQKIGLLQYQQQIASDATTATRRYDVLNKDIDLDNKRYNSLVKQEKDLLAIIWDPQANQFQSDATIAAKLKGMNAGVAWNPTSIKSMLDSIKQDKTAVHRMLNEKLQLRHSLYGIPGVNYQSLSTEPTLEEKFQALTSTDPRATGQTSTGSTATPEEAARDEGTAWKDIKSIIGDVAEVVHEQVGSGNVGVGQNNVFNRLFGSFVKFASGQDNPVHNLYRRAAEKLGVDPNAVTDFVMEGVGTIADSPFSPNFANQAFEWVHKQAGIAPENTANFWLNEGLQDRMVEIMQAAGGDFEKFKVLAADKFEEYIDVSQEVLKSGREKITDLTGIGAIKPTLTGPTPINVLGATITVTPDLEVSYRQRARDELNNQDKWMELLERDVQSSIEATRLEQQAQSIQAGAGEFDIATETVDDMDAISETQSPGSISVVPEYAVFQQRLAQAASAALPSTFGAQPQGQSSPAGAQSPAAMPASLFPNQQGVAQPPTAASASPMAQGDPTAAGGLGGGMLGSQAQMPSPREGLTKDELAAIIQGSYPSATNAATPAATNAATPGVDQFRSPEVATAVSLGAQPHRPSDLMSARDLTLEQFPGWTTLEGEVQSGDMGVVPSTFGDFELDPSYLEPFMTNDELASSRYDALDQESIDDLEGFISEHSRVGADPGVSEYSPERSELLDAAQRQINYLRNVEETGERRVVQEWIQENVGDAAQAAWDKISDLSAEELAEWFANPNNRGDIGKALGVTTAAWTLMDARAKKLAAAEAEGLLKKLNGFKTSQTEARNEIKTLKKFKPEGWADKVKGHQKAIDNLKMKIHTERRNVWGRGGTYSQLIKKQTGTSGSVLKKIIGRPGKKTALFAAAATLTLLASDVFADDPEASRAMMLEMHEGMQDANPEELKAIENLFFALGISNPAGLAVEGLWQAMQAIGSPQGAGTGGTTNIFAAPGSAMGSGGFGSLRDPQWTGAYTGGTPAKDISYNTSGESVVPEWRPGGLNAEEMRALESTLTPASAGMNSPVINQESPSAKMLLDEVLSNRAAKKKLDNRFSLISGAQAADVATPSDIKDSDIPVDLLYKAIHGAEFRGSWKGLRKNWGKNTFIRTRHAPALGSSAYGPLQITKGLMERQRPKLRGVLTKEEQNYIDRFIDQANTFLKYGREPDLEGYQKRYDYGGAGDLNSRNDMRLYKSVGKKLIALGFREAEGDLVRFARDWRYGDNSTKSLESSDPEYYRSYKRIIDEGNN